LNRILLIPKRFAYLHGKGDDCLGYMCLYEAIERVLGFKIIFTDTISGIPEDTEIIICALRNHTYQDLLSIPKRAKLILFLSDIHGYTKKYLDSHLEFFDRADVIFGILNELFLNQWPQYSDKFRWLPQYFKHHDRYASLPFNANPVMRCLFTGNVNGIYYPVRSHIKSEVESRPEYRDYFDVLRHAWYPEQTKVDWALPPALGADYARILNRYYCSIATPGSIGVTAKYVEIMATGSLLLGVTVKDFLDMGYIPNVHYVPITKNDWFSKVKEVLANPLLYNGVRLNGMEFTRKNHSVQNRFGQTAEVVSEILA